MTKVSEGYRSSLRHADVTLGHSGSSGQKRSAVQMFGAPTARTSGAEDHAEEATETLPEVVGQESVENRIHAAVHVGKTTTGDLSSNEGEVVVSVVSDELDDQYQLQGQPAYSEDDDDNDNEARHASLAAHALSRWLSTSGSDAVEKSLDHQTVQETDHGERDDVGKREEARVVDASVVVIVLRIIVVVNECVETSGPLMPVEMILHGAMLNDHREVDPEDEYPGHRRYDYRVPPRS